MKIETKNNNPVAVGALLCILAVTVTLTIRQLLPGGDAPAAAVAVAPVAAAPGAAAQAPTVAQSVRPIVWQGRRSKRDPFYHPVLSLRIGARAYPGSGPAGNPRAVTPLAVMPPNFEQGVTIRGVTPGSVRKPVNPPLPVVAPLPKPQKRVIAAAAVPVAAAVRPSARPAGPSVRDREAALAAGMKITAIFGVSQRNAVIEGAETDPITVRVGDRVQMLRVVAINEYDVVLAGAGGKWTVPLQAAPEGETDEPAPQENHDVPH